ncbi:hypothetical protein AFLA_006476 [Aspergillus flavus NRRL3357]|nr:hypothetical protein AFLA_006476 [Aspergillus flavus NRRL3357]
MLKLLPRSSASVNLPRPQGRQHPAIHTPYMEMLNVLCPRLLLRTVQRPDLALTAKKNSCLFDGSAAPQGRDGLLRD